MSEISTKGGHDQFEKRSLQLAEVFGVCADKFEALPEQYKDFFVIIGYVRICSLLIISDLNRGRSERELAQRYGLTRSQIEGIKEKSRLCGRRKEV